MTLIPKRTKGNTDNPQIVEIFNMFETAAGAIPGPLQLLANSPGLFEIQMSQLAYYRDHEKFSPEFLALIRLLAASWYENAACIEFNSALLRKMGLRASELSLIIEDPLSAPLDINELQLLNFVIKSIKAQTPATLEEIARLCDLGWRHSDIIDAVNHGVTMFTAGKMLKLFGMM